MSRRQTVFGRVAQGTNRTRTRDETAIRAAIQRITSMSEWNVLLDYLDLNEKRHTALADQSTDSGALLRAAGRRSLLRELEVLDGRVIDDDRSDQSG